MTFRTIDLARAGGVSPSSVRFYEAEGFLPPVERRPSGQRLFRLIHRDAMVTSRALIAGYGWQQAKAVMHAVHGGDLDQMVHLVDARHGQLDRERREAHATVGLLETLAQEGTDGGRVPPRHTVQRIGDVACLLDVPVPTLRFWEAQGLVAPHHNATSGYREYAPRDVTQLHVIATLRRSGYGIAHVRDVMAAVRRNNVAAALAGARQRIDDLTRAGHACLAATGALHVYIATWHQAEPQP